MSNKPTTASGYSPELAIEARQMCLFVATIFGDLLSDIVVVGGLVPSLIISQTEDQDRHVGTRDVDIGLSLAVLDAERYRQISDRLKERGFEPGKNEQGRITRQTWARKGTSVMLDFLIPEVEGGAAPGKLQSLEHDFAAFVTPALPLAFLDHVMVTLDDVTPNSERARREIRVCGPAAFVVLKALAFRGRGENKDAYDLVYVLQGYGSGVRDVASRFTPIASEPHAADALAILREDFETQAHLGPRRYAEFLGTGDREQLSAEAYALVAEFLRLVSQPGR